MSATLTADQRIVLRLAAADIYRCQSKIADIVDAIERIGTVDGRACLASNGVDDDTLYRLLDLTDAACCALADLRLELRPLDAAATFPSTDQEGAE